MSTLEAYIEQLDGLVRDLSPQARRKLTRDIGNEMRRRNAERIKKNVSPDGTAFVPRNGYGWEIRALKPGETLKPGQRFNYFRSRDLSMKYVKDMGNRFVGEETTEGNPGYRASGFLKKYIYIKKAARRRAMFKKMGAFKWLKIRSTENEAAFGFMSGIIGKIAAEHQIGSNSKNLPPRELIGFSQDDLDYIYNRIIESLHSES